MAEISQECTSVFRQLFRVEDMKLNDQLRRDLETEIVKFSKAGLSNSGRAIVAVSDFAARTIPVRAQTALNLLIRCMGQFGEPINEESRTAALQLIDAEVRNSAGRAKDIALQSTPSRQNYPRREVLASIDESLDLELTRIDGEIRLMVAASKRQATTEGNAGHITVNGQVGMIQTGPGSYGVASINVDASSNVTLLQALEAVKNALTEADDLPFDRAEVREMINQATTELAKPKPNGTMLRSLLAGIGGAIAFAPKVKVAYDTLKWAAKLAGIELP